MNKDSRDILSATQSQYISYITEHEKKAERIIFYKHNGHFGEEFALLSRYPKIQLINFRQLKGLTGKNICFRILHIIAAIGTFILNTSKKIDARTSISTILSNAENIYLGIDKGKEYLKYLRIKKTPHKYKKIKFIIRIEEDDIETDEDISCLRLLCNLIKSGRINNSLLLITDEKVRLLNIGIKIDNEAFPFFQLSKDDLSFIAKRKNLKVNEVIFKNINLVKQFGLQFFLDNYIFFETLSDVQNQTYDWIQKMDWIIKQMINRSRLTDKELYPLLEFVSFFEHSFSKVEIQKFNKNALESDNLEIAYKLSILDREKASCNIIPNYFYKINSFKQYFSKKYLNDLKPMPEDIFLYFRKFFPFDYLPALKILQIDTSILDYKSKQSLVICGYYYEKIKKGYVNSKDYTCFISKDSISITIINIYEFFRNKKNGNFLIDVQKILNKLQNNSLDSIATCASYVILLQFLKENFLIFPIIDYSNVLMEYRTKIFEIDTNNNYGKYWQVHFKCLYIALSLEDENTNNRTARRFMDDIQKMRNDDNFCMYIKENYLRDFSRIDLLSFSIGHDDAGNILHNLYLSSEDSSIIKELARINYSGYLIETEKYDEAEQILQKGNLNFLKNINIDTYCGYLNNYYLAQLKCRKISGKEYIYSVSKLLQKDISCGDKFIIENNWASVQLMFHQNEEYAIKKLNEIYEKGNPFNSFYALHNLLAFYFTTNDSQNFEKFYSKIFIPKLLRADSTLFHRKFKWMQENMGKAEFTSFKNNFNDTPCYNQLYLMSPIERWFE